MSGKAKDDEARPSTYPPPPTEQPPPQRPGGYYPPHDSRPPQAPPEDERNGYNSHEGARSGQYAGESRGPPPGPYGSDPRAQAPYGPPSAWHHPPPGHYPHPHYDPAHAAHYYHPGPPADMSHPPQPRHPDLYRLPPPYPYGGYGPPSHYPQPPPPAPRQRTAIACKYCRKRKIRCSGYESSRDGRCNNCVRFNQNCLFHPVSSQAAFVPAQAVYPNMPNNREDPPPPNPRGDYRGSGMYHREGESPPVLYGAHGIPLAPAAAQDHHGGYPPPAGYPPGYPPPHAHGPPGPYDYRAQPPPPHAPAEEKHSRKRGPPDDDAPSGSPNSSQSPHPSSRPRRSHEPRNSTSASNANGFDYPEPSNIAPTSPSTSSTSYHSGYPYAGQSHKAPRRHSPQSAHSFDSPRTLPIRDEGKSTPPGQPASGPGPAAERGGMSVQAMLGGGDSRKAAEAEGNGHRRPKDDREMLSKLDGKK